jgi:nucleoside-diphosphate-sugar epimerase
MNILILGLGNVGKALASTLREKGHRVTGTTTTEAKQPGLLQYADEVVVLRGTDREKIQAAASACDAIVVTVAPDVRRALNKEEREATYREALVDSCENAAAACKRVLFLSSFSVYGDGGEGEGPISESTPTSNHEEPSSKYYQLAEQAVTASAQGCVLRLPDIYGAPGDMSFPDRVRFGIKLMGGKVPFGPDAPLYCIHYLDVVEAARLALENELAGTYNVCDNERLPATNKQVFDAICDREGLQHLVFLNQIKAPKRRISAQKIYDAGFSIVHSDLQHPLKGNA